MAKITESHKLARRIERAAIDLNAAIAEARSRSDIRVEIELQPTMEVRPRVWTEFAPKIVAIDRIEPDDDPLAIPGFLRKEPAPTGA